MWARIGYSMKWHLVRNMEVEYDYRSYKYNVELKKGEWITEKRVGVEMPSHAGNVYYEKQYMKFKEVLDINRSQVCAYCRREALAKAEMPKEVML